MIMYADTNIKRGITMCQIYLRKKEIIVLKTIRCP